MLLKVEKNWRNQKYHFIVFLVNAFKDIIEFEVNKKVSNLIY